MKSIVAIILAITAITVQADQAFMSAGVASITGKTGLELDIGKRYNTSGNAVIEVTPLGFTVTHGNPTPGYRSETFANNQTVCRNTSNGQFSEKTNCDSSSVSYTPKVSVDFGNELIRVGAGAKFGTGGGAFAYVGNNRVRVAAGKDYASVTLRLSF